MDKVAVSYTHTVLLRDGAAWGAGSNDHKQLGNHGNKLRRIATGAPGEVVGDVAVTLQSTILLLSPSQNVIMLGRGEDGFRVVHEKTEGALAMRVFGADDQFVVVTQDIT